MSTKKVWEASLTRVRRQFRHEWLGNEMTQVSHQVLVTLTIAEGPEAGREIQVWMDVTRALQHIFAMTEAAIDADSQNRESML